MINDLVYGSVTIEASTLTILVEHIEKSHFNEVNVRLVRVPLH